MKRSSFACSLVLFAFFYLAALPGRGSDTPNKSISASAPAPSAELAALVEKQFGPDFEIVTESPASKIVGAMLMEHVQTPWKPLFIGDFDGDGVEDAIIVARNKNAMIGSQAYNYKVYDAFNDHFGYGNPMVTASFNANDPLHNMLLLVIHGAGPEAWRAETPKAKYVLINVPFEQVSIARTKYKKKVIDTIRVEESDTVSSVLFFDGKKYRYIPGGGSN